MEIHTLKTRPQYWEAVYDGRKTFEIRKFDRNFNIGDILKLKRTISEIDHRIDFTYQELSVKITYMLGGSEFGIKPGFIILGIKKLRGSELIRLDNNGTLDR